MPHDDLARRLRRALDGEPKFTAAVGPPGEPQIPRHRPLQQLEHLATHGKSESVRLQESRLLLEREESERARRASANGADDNGEAPTVREIVAAMSPAEVEREWDLFCGARTVEKALAADGKYPRMAAAIHTAVREQTEARVRQLLDPEQREREIEERAQARAEELYRTRAFKAVTTSEPSPSESAS
jgi:hypothetical protein